MSDFTHLVEAENDDLIPASQPAGFWTAARKKLVHQLWEKGCVATYIANQIGATRNMICGYLHRNGMSAAKRVAKPVYAKRARARPWSPTPEASDGQDRRNETRRINAEIGKGNARAKPVTLSRSDAGPAKIKPRDTPALVCTEATLAPDCSHRGLSFWELRSYHCRWPVAGEGLNIEFCRARKVRGSYCKHHHDISVRGD